MKDIARELQLSITTVSFVVNGKCDSISPATVKKVRALIKKRGFNPNSAARILRTGQSKTIGLIVEDIGNYFFGNIAKIIEKEAHKNGYNVFFSSTENNDDNAKDLISKMKNSSVDGLIITATRGLKEEIEKFTTENLPFVLIDRLVPGVESNYVIVDNYNGAYELTKHLLNNGYKKIGFVSIKDGMTQMFDRKRGFIDALTEHNITITPKTLLEVSFSDNEKALETIKKYLQKNPQLDALFFATNYLGVLGIEAMQQNKLRIPLDMAVVSFDDNDLFRLFTPAITVAAQPIEEIANKSIEMLLKIIKKETKKAKLSGEIIKPNIIIRNSSPKKKIAAVQEPA
ncbi:MAG: LacI family DNA-binding transcriptional regulator [Chitinophagaceae bacterium]